jgi:hypothetical protein
LSGWTEKPGRANAKAITAICAEDDGVIRLLPSLNPPGLAAGTSSIIASADVRKVFSPSRDRFWVKTARFFVASYPKSIEG